MSKEEALQLIDDHKNALIDPVEMLRWTWLRVIILNLDEETWQAAVERASATMSR